MSVSRLLNPRGPANASINSAAGRGYVYDADAETYIAAVEAADGQRLEWGVRQAISQFVAGCKTDGVWTPIKASCILMGARTLAGALTPLVGSAPTNVNFVSGDYSRTTGLVGNNSNKYLNTGRNNNTSGQDDFHLAVFGEDPNKANTSYGGAGNTTAAGSTYLNTVAASLYGQCRSTTLDAVGVPRLAMNRTFYGMNRSSSTAFTYQFCGYSVNVTRTSGTPYDGNIYIFARNDGGTAAAYTNARLAFYSTGDGLTLSSLSSRVSSLYHSIMAALT